MNNQLTDLIRFYSQHHHALISIVNEPYQIEEWDRNGILIAIQISGNRTVHHDGLELRLHDTFGSNVLGDDISYGPYSIGVVSESILCIRFVCDSDGTQMLARDLIDKHLPRMARKFRRQSHGKFMETMNGCRETRSRDLRVNVRDDEFEVQRLSAEIVTTSRRLQVNRHMAAILDKPEDWLLRRHQRMFIELMRLTPGSFAGFRFEDDCIIGTTHPITIEFEGTDYHFESYDVIIDLSKPEVRIEGCEIAEHLHPHVASSDNICWGNIGGLVSQLLGQMDLPGLFQLVHQFLHTYNCDDPFQKIQFWDPNWSEDDEGEEPWCEFCDDMGHSVNECDWCWWCEACQAYVDHSEDSCPNRKETEDEELVEEAA